MKRINENGFSLIEVVISLALSVILTLAVVTVVLTAHRVKHINSQKLECLALSKSIVDEISSERTIWGTKNNLGAWLLSKNFTQVSNVLYKRNSVDSNNASYVTYVEIIDTNVDNLFDVKVTSSSKEVEAVSITRRLRSG